MLHNHLPQHSNFVSKFGPEGCFNIATGPNQSDRVRIKMTDAPISGDAPAIQEIISRADAKARGLKRYFTGQPCSREHIACRYVINGRCLDCMASSVDPEYAKKYYAKNAEKIRRRAKDWATENPDRLKETRRTHYKTNKEELNRKNSERYYANRSHYNALAKKWRIENPERKAELDRAYRKANPEKYAKISRKYYEQNKDIHAQRTADWRARNKSKCKVYKSERRAREQNAEGYHTAKQIDALFIKQRGKCVVCKSCLKKGFHADHIMPLFSGGSNWISNIQLLCAPCNLRKNKKDPFKFAQENGRLL